MTANARGVTGGLDLLNRIRQVADERGDAAAFVFVNHRGQEEALSWRVLSATVSEQVRRIRQQTSLGSVITAPAQSTPTAVAVFLAVLAAGRTLFPLDPRNPAVSSQRLLDEVRRQGGPIDNIESLFRHDDPGPGAAGVVPGSRGGSAFAAGGYILASGGSTGLPKPIHRPGAPYYDPRNVPSALLRRTGWRNHQTQLLSGPLHHAAPFSRLIDGVLSGNTLVIPQIFKSDLILGVIERYRVDWMQLTPSNMQLLDDELSRHPDAFSSVRGVLHSAAPCPVDTKRTWINKLGGGRVFEMYTSTENVGMTLCDGDEWFAHPGTVGRGFFTRLRILGDDGVPLPPGQVGEVYMRSIQKSRSSSGGSRPSRDGYESVGDRGHLDHDGYLYLSGRREDLVIVGGENVYVSEVTSAILTCSGIADAAVVDVPDPLLGSRLCALVVRHPFAGLTARDVLGHCLSRLAPYKVPSAVSFVDSLPRTAAGKLDRGSLPPVLDTP